MELKWKDLILAAFLLSKRNPSMAKAGFGPAPPRGCPAGTLRLRLPNARPLAAEGPLALAALAKDPSRVHFATGPRQVAGLNRSSCCNAVR
jgi:hypothetical protein